MVICRLNPLTIRHCDAVALVKTCFLERGIRFGYNSLLPIPRVDLEPQPKFVKLSSFHRPPCSFDESVERHTFTYLIPTLKQAGSGCSSTLVLDAYEGDLRPVHLQEGQLYVLPDLGLHHGE